MTKLTVRFVLMPTLITDKSNYATMSVAINAEKRAARHGGIFDASGGLVNLLTRGG